MDRWACVDLVAFPLQLLLKAHPDWAHLPCAVVADDAPQALVQFVNARAYKLGVRPGQRYATALALASALQAGVVSRPDIDQHVHLLTDRLRRYSPHVEPSITTPGVFWLDARGLNRLYPSLREWAQAVRLEMQRAEMRATVAVGFTRVGVYVLTRCHQGITVCTEEGEERAAVQRAPLSSIDLAPEAHARLAALGVETVGAFLQLPEHGIRQRFGDAAHSLYQLASGQRWAPLVPVPAEAPHTRLIHFDAPVVNTERLVFVIKRLIDSLTAALAAEGHAVLELVLAMTLDDRTMKTADVRPAAPTLDGAQLLTLVRLRLDSLHWSSGIVTLRLTAAGSPVTADQRRLFPQGGRRDPEQAHEALARVRAEFGERSVVRARLGSAHLPAAQFEWEPFDRIPARTSPIVVTMRPLVRRIHMQPLPLPPAFSLQTSGFGLQPDSRGPAEAGHYVLKPNAQSSAPSAALGPYTIAGAWWGRGVRRDYYFAPVEGGNLWWVYYDHERQRFFLQGCVE